MNRQKELNEFVKDCLTQALFELMNVKPFDEISVTELVAKAGVSRATFYRNFGSKKSVIEKYLQTLIMELNKESQSADDWETFSVSLLNHFYDHKEVYLLLYRQHMANLIYEEIRWSMKINDDEDNVECYKKSTIAGLVFGAVDEWIRRGMKETPDEILAMELGV
ncbi:MAG: TetR/AcrR family transcriptional regulator [Oscillospiraceae bacterium]|nr:TetR/AcrR family transcriptional regulator [Oscillospiraceae bacterium]